MHGQSGRLCPLVPKDEGSYLTCMWGLYWETGRAGTPLTPAPLGSLLCLGRLHSSSPEPVCKPSGRQGSERPEQVIGSDLKPKPGGELGRARKGHQLSPKCVPGPSSFPLQPCLLFLSRP